MQQPRCNVEPTAAEGQADQRDNAILNQL